MNVFRINFWLAFALLAVLTIDSIAASEPEIKATPQRRQFSPGDGYYKPNAAPQRRQIPPGDGNNKPNTAPQRRQFPLGDEQYIAPHHYPAPHYNPAPHRYPAPRQWYPPVTDGKSEYQQRSSQYESKNNYPSNKLKPLCVYP